MITFKNYLEESLSDYTTMRIKGRQWAGNGMGTDPGSHELCMGKGARRRIPTGITIHGMRSGGYVVRHYDDKVGTADSFNTAKEKAIAHHKKMLGESVELAEMAGKSKLQPNSTHGPMNTNELRNLIGKTKFGALTKHKWYQQHIGSASSIPGIQTAHKVTVDHYGYPTVHSTTNFIYKHPTKGHETRTMIQTAMSKDGGKVHQVHLFHNYDNERHSKEHGGTPVWYWQRSLHNDDKKD